MFETVRAFENQIAKYYGAPYAVATDSCTHAIELCLRYLKPQVYVKIPARTYISIPFTLTKVGVNWTFIDKPWSEYYFLEGTNIIDGAVNFKRDSYVKDQFMCLSFQFKKMLNLGRGGAILCTSKEEYNILKRMSYDGRLDDTPWANQDIEHIGYHYYMTPETAQLGIEKLKTIKQGKLWTSNDYPYLPNMKVFK